MVLATALLIAVTAGGFASTYFYDYRAPLLARLAAAAVVGFAVFSLVGLIAASALGFGWPSVVTATAIAASPTLAIFVESTRQQLLSDIKRAAARLTVLVRRPRTAVALFVGLAAASALYSLMDRAMIVLPNGSVRTGVLHNFGDLPFHLSVVTRFVAGNNLPPEHPSFAGVPFTYPFLTDFLSAQLMMAGADLRTAIVLPAILGAFALVLLLYQWTQELTGDTLAACIAPVLLLMGG